MTRGRIFINYRRDDSRADSGRLYDRLAARFPGQIFRDVASLEPGVEWQDAIARVLNQTDACIVVIGKDWVSITDAKGHRRLDDPRDTVRQEIVTALERKMRVFPVLVGGASMPAEDELPVEIQGLCRRNALHITEQDWDEDFAKLVRAVETALGFRPTPPVGTARPARLKWAAVGAGIALIILAVYAGSNHASVPPAPRRQPLTPAHFTGNWEAQVTSNGQTLDELVEIYGDNSFRVTLGGTLAAVGKWRYNPANESLEVTDGANFLPNGRGGRGLYNVVKFTCAWKNANADEWRGNCTDRQQNSWGVALARTDGTLPIDAAIPRVDTSALTLAERAAFAQVLAAMRCTCPCGLTVLVCLQKDQTCPYSPDMARNALVDFLRVTRS